MAATRQRQMSSATSSPGEGYFTPESDSEEDLDQPDHVIRMKKLSRDDAGEHGEEEALFLPQHDAEQTFELYTPDEDKAVLKKLDRRLVLFMALLYMLSFLDRSSKFIARATLAFS